MTSIFKTIIVAYGLVPVSILLSSCGNRETSNIEAEYWRVDETFVSPSDWETREFADAFSLDIPPYMRETYMADEGHLLTDTPLVPGEWNETSFNSKRNDTAHDNYAHIGIKYLKGNDGDFNGYLDCLFPSQPEVSQFCDLLIKKQLGTGKLIKVLDKQFICLNDCGGLDMCYQRVGNTIGEGPVTVHIFFLQNYDEAVQVTVSYHEKNKDAYKDLYNLIATFKWKNKNFNYKDRK